MGREAIVPLLLAPPPPRPNHYHHHGSLHLELDERDVVWPHTSQSTHGPPASPATTTSSSPSPSPSPRPDSKLGLGLGLGLSAALSPDPLPPSLLPKRTPTAAAMAVPLPRSDERSFLSGSGRPMQMSAPVNIPVWPNRRSGRPSGMWDVEEKVEEEVDVEEDGEGMMVPPHVLVARSRAMSFSVFEGVGRTLKGRDLREVRNAVLQKTGFLD